MRHESHLGSAEAGLSSAGTELPGWRAGQGGELVKGAQQMVAWAGALRAGFEWPWSL